MPQTKRKAIFKTPVWDNKGYAGLDDWIRESRQPQLEKLLLTGLTDIFGASYGKGLFERIIERIENLKIPRDNQAIEQSHRWENTIVVYPGTFGGFAGLAQVIPALAKLGVTQVHVLPLYEAGGDDGFSVINYQMGKPLRIAKQWGGEEKFRALVEAAQANGLQLMLDAVLNHIDIHSPVLQQDGLEDLTMCFKAGEEPFEFLRVEQDESGGQYAVYNFKGQEVRQLIIFPEQARIGKETPQLIKVNGLSVWHTFYPFQLDLDLNKPAAFELTVNTLLQIAEWLKGRGTIRLDAIPFVGKKINNEVFEYMDSDRGYQLISLMRIVLAMGAPRMKLLAEAARPLQELKQYPDRVGGGYDFFSLHLFLEALLTKDASGLVKGINQLIGEMGLAGMKKLAFILQTHDDYPISERKPEAVLKMWRLLKEKGALPFGLDSEKGIPRAAVIRLSEICDQSEEKLLTALALAAMMPHGCLLWLYGTEIGVGGSRENLEKDRKLALKQGRKADNRAYIRQPIDKDEYLQALQSDFSQRLAEVLKRRSEMMPEVLEKFEIKTINNGAVVIVTVQGQTNGESRHLRGVFNFSDREQVINQRERLDGNRFIIEFE
ncbi:MAG: alpha-amylase family glycosyl hydrolase [Patescibacteria group bacterium]|nr:alpha-amylase family glycosyl hydrolase [Patescibacteria group bacterium]